MASTEEKITLGSGELYLAEYADTMPDPKTLETEQNRLGWIKGGAELEYKGEWYEVTDDLGHVQKSMTTSEEAVIKTGILTWNGNTLSKLCTTAKVTEAAGHRTVKIGGVKNQNGKSYIIHFVHTSDNGAKTRVTIVGKNRNGFNLAFMQDKETIVDAEFKAEPSDRDGTLIIYDEEIPSVPPAKVV